MTISRIKQTNNLCSIGNSFQSSCCSPGEILDEIKDCKQQRVVNPNRARHIAGHLDKEDVVKFNNKKTKQCLSNGICVQADSLEEAQNKLDDGKGTKHKVVQKLDSGIKSNLKAAERIIEKGSDSNLTKSDKEYVAHQMQHSLLETKEITKNPTMRNFLGNTRDALCHWVSNFSDFIRNLFSCNDECEKKEKEKKLCEERKGQLDKIRKSCSRMARAKRQKNKFFALMEEAKRKISEFFGNKDQYARKELDKYTHHFDYDKNKYREEGMREDYYKSIGVEIQDDLLPSYICHSSGFNLELDLIC